MILKNILFATTLTSFLVLSGCNLTSLTNNLTQIDTAVKQYAPLVGKDLILIGDIAVTAYCSPLINATGQVTSNILNIVAPNSSTATGINDVLTKNSQIAAQLCPLVKSIQVVVGTVPTGTPSQTIPSTVATLQRPGHRH